MGALRGGRERIMHVAEVFIRERLVDWSKGDMGGENAATSTHTRLRVARSKLNLANPVEVLRMELAGAPPPLPPPPPPPQQQRARARPRHRCTSLAARGWLACAWLTSAPLRELRRGRASEHDALHEAPRGAAGRARARARRLRRVDAGRSGERRPRQGPGPFHVREARVGAGAGVCSAAAAQGGCARARGAACRWRSSWTLRRTRMCS